ncbi:substrate-binding domain-containing protein [Deinococcus sp.]|uniref:substrate-binding domain-containing protein n=1 Tax=Deinococcus sp. TaxID=47478 RepID=UPI002869CBB5|nr:substrate-binding domain-containing protein [Deinococcus sp.]
MFSRPFWRAPRDVSRRIQPPAPREWHGHARTLYLGTLTRHESAIDRELGYRAAMGHEPQAGRVERVETVTAKLVSRMMNAGVTGMLFENERLTADWVAAAGTLGLRWPQEYGFAVLGDPIYQGVLPAGWAHVTIPQLEMGREAVRLLAGLFACPPGTASCPVSGCRGASWEYHRPTPGDAARCSAAGSKKSQSISMLKRLFIVQFLGFHQVAVSTNSSLEHHK